MIDRSSGIGGSDAAALVGLHPQRGAFDVYCDKLGLIEKVIDETNQRMHWGKRLEKLIAEEYSAVTGRQLHWLDVTMRNPERAWQIGTPDAESTVEALGLEVKTAGVDQRWKWGGSGTDELPDHYAIQCQWYMSLLGYPYWDVAALIGGNDFRIYTVEFDPQIETMLLEVAERFWREHIGKRVAPPLDASESAKRYLRERFPHAIADLRTPDADELHLIARYREVRAEFERIEVDKEALENQIKGAIGDSTGFRLADGTIKWVDVKGSTYTVERKPYRKFDVRLKETA